MNCQASICPICCSDYDDKDCLPRIIPDCGHTICSECLKTLLKKRSDAKCPLDKGKFPSDKPNLEDYKVNYGLKQLLEEAANFETCPKHHERLRLICHTDKKKICDDCVHFGDHKDHDVRPLKEIQPALDAKKRELETSLARFEKHATNSANRLNDIKDDIKKTVKARFQELIFLIQMKEEEMLSQLDNFVDSQRQLLNSTIGFNSNAKKEISEKLSDYRDTSRCNDIFELLAQDITPITSKFTEAVLKERFQNYNQSLNDVVTSLSNSLKNQTLLISELPTPNQLILEANINLLRHYDEKISIDTVSDKITLKGSITLDIQEDFLTVSLDDCPNPEKDITFSPQELKNIKKLKVVIDTISGAMKNNLFTIFKQIGNIESLELTCTKANLTDASLSAVVTALAWKLHTLDSLKIDFQNCRGLLSNTEITSSIQQLLSKLAKVRHLDVNLSETAINDSFLIGFAASSAHFIKELEVFNFALQGTGISEPGLSEIFVAMPKLNTLFLNLMNIHMYDEALEFLKSRTLPSITNLERFGLLLSDTQVSDHICTQLFSNMENVKEFFLALNNTRITDATIEILSSALIGIASNIENFALFLDHTRVSDDGMTQICGLMENTKEFILSLNGTRVADKTLEAFSEITLPSMKNLKNIHLGFKNTQISDNSAISCIMNMQGVPTFSLDFDGTALTHKFAESFSKAISAFPELKEFNLSVTSTQIPMQGFMMIQEAQKQVIQRNQSLTH